MEKLLIKKADGTTEVFNEGKLRHSLKRSGAKNDDIEKVVSHVRSEIGEDVTTSDIYRHAFHVLNKLGGSVAAKYSLSRAIMQLGPSGFPFENFLARVLTEKGYKTETGVELVGKCAEHEVDVVAENDEKIIMIEAKFHNRAGVKSDMKVILYIHARYEDLHKGNFGNLDMGNKKEEFWLVTNTKFTKNSMRYGKCAGLKMISWSYPEKGNLQEMIEDSGLQPLTCLTSLEESEKAHLLNKGVVLCKSVLEKPSLLAETGLSKERQDKAINELKDLYK